MLSSSLRVFLSIGLILYFTMIFTFLKRKALSLKYTLLWLFAGTAMGFLIIFPQLLDWAIDIIDIKSPVNGLFAIGIFFLLIIMMSITSIVSKQSDIIKRLVQDNAFLEKRIRELEDKKPEDTIVGYTIAEDTIEEDIIAEDKIDIV